MPTFLPYLIIAFIIFLLYLCEIKKIKAITPKAARWTAYIIMWLFIGFRGHIMSDFILYFPYFNRAPDLIHLSFSHLDSRFEPGFIIYTALFKLICTDYFAWVSFNTIIDLAVLAWFFKRYCKSMILPLIFFLAYNGLLMEFNLYRNMKAIDLFLLSIPYLQQKKILPYFILNIIGCSFHISSLIYLPLFFIIQRKIPKWLIWGGFAVANIIFLCNIEFISLLVNNMGIIKKLQAYDNIIGYQNTATEVKFSIGYFERTLTFILFSYFYSKLIKNSTANIIFYNSFWIYYCSYLTLHEVQVFVDRIPYLFIFSYWTLYPAVINLRSKYHSFVNLAIAILAVLKISTGLSHPASKYESIMFEYSNYNERKKLYESTK